MSHNAFPSTKTKVNIPVAIKEPSTARRLGLAKAWDGYDCELETHYDAGPASDRVAVLDRDPDGKLHPGVAYVSPQQSGQKKGRFAVPVLPTSPGQKIQHNYNVSSREFNQASVFGTVLRTMKLFEDRRVLGRPVAWQAGKQLQVIPRAGLLANAFYDRDTRSLQFFYFQAAAAPQPWIYTSLSRDIVAHETAHAILDGIAPGLMETVSPQALAIHEAVADLAAVMLAAESRELVLRELEASRGALVDSNAFSAIAQEFGRGLQRDYLRQLVNPKTLASVAGDEPHELSEVLSGALFAVLVKLHEEHRRKYSQDEEFRGRDDPMYSCSGKAFAAACFRLRNSVFRALDYLPPGEVSFADFGRAVLAVDEMGRLNPPHVREWLRQELVDRGIVADAAELAVLMNFRCEALVELDLDRLVAADSPGRQALAREFVLRHRDLFSIPPGATPRVHPPLVTRRIYYDEDRRETEVEECLMKVDWLETEDNDVEGCPAPQREVRLGTTMSINLRQKPAEQEQWPQKREVYVRVLLTSERSAALARARSRAIARLLAEGLLRLDAEARAPDGTSLRSFVLGSTEGGVLRLQGAGRQLHIRGTEELAWTP